VALKQLSAAKYGRPKAIIEQEINERMATKGERPPVGGYGTAPLGSGTPAMTPATPRPAAAPPPSGGGSFLDEWLNKRRSGAVTASPANAPAVTITTPAIRRQQARMPDEPLPAATRPFQAPATPVSTPAAAAARTTQNISSNELEGNEVHEIAAELRQELDSPKPKKTEHSIDLQSGASEGDTIFIDRDGSFRQAEKPAASQQQTSS
jgi:hypothetical protein